MPHTLEVFVSCDTMPALQGPTTDHLPVVSILDLQIPHRDLPPHWDFRGTDWEVFEKKLDEYLLIKPPRTLTTTQEVDDTGAHIIGAMQRTIDEVVPIAKPCPHSKRWWMKDLDKLRRSMVSLTRKCYRMHDVPGHLLHADLQAAKAKYTKEICKTKERPWKDWLDEANDNDIWTANRYI